MVTGGGVVKICHWNAGTKLWTNKITIIEALLQEKCPDLLFVSEANLWNYMKEEDIFIPDYKIILPKLYEQMGTCKNSFTGKK